MKISKPGIHVGVFFKWANFGPVRFCHWWVKIRKQKHCFIYLPHMYMISNWKAFTIKQSWFTNLSDNIINVLGSKSILSTIWPRTFHFPGRSMLNSTISRERKKFVVRSLRSRLLQKYWGYIQINLWIGFVWLRILFNLKSCTYAVHKWSNIFVFLLSPIKCKNDRAQN